MRPLFSSLFSALFALLARATAVADPLWEKAVKIAGRSIERLPAIAFFRLDLPGDKGIALGKFVTWYRISRNPDGTVVPVEAVFTVKPLAPFVMEMKTTMKYGEDAANAGCLQESMVEGLAGLLFVRQRFRTTVTLRGYSPVAFRNP